LSTFKFLTKTFPLWSKHLSKMYPAANYLLVT